MKATLHILFTLVAALAIAGCAHHRAGDRLGNPSSKALAGANRHEITLVHDRGNSTVTLALTDNVGNGDRKFKAAKGQHIFWRNHEGKKFSILVLNTNDWSLPPGWSWTAPECCDGCGAVAASAAAGDSLVHLIFSPSAMDEVHYKVIVPADQAALRVFAIP